MEKIINLQKEKINVEVYDTSHAMMTFDIE